MPKKIIAYQCQYCGAIKRTRAIAERHERACLKNPNGINCLNCKFHRIDAEGNSYCEISGGECRRDISANCTEYERKED